MGPSGAKTRYFLLFPRLKHAEQFPFCAFLWGARAFCALPPFCCARLASARPAPPGTQWSGESGRTGRAAALDAQRHFAVAVQTAS